jgi:hypothetical protein
LDPAAAALFTANKLATERPGAHRSSHRDMWIALIKLNDRQAPSTARALAASFLATCLLAGCSTSDGVEHFIVDPGHYSAYHCDALKTRLEELLTREQELSNLMQRASETAGGTLIGDLSYRADYENAVGEEKVLRRTAADKKCELPAPAAPALPAVPPPRNAPAFQSNQPIR